MTIHFQIILYWSIIRFSLAQDSAEEVCYPHIGCFSLESPWDGFWRFTPLSPPDVNVRFYVITRKTQEQSTEEWKVTTNDKYEPYGEKDLQKVDYQQQRSMTVVQIYGLFSDEKKKWKRLKNMAQAYLFRKDVNVIVVDWDSDSHKYDYRQSVSNTRITAAITVKFIEYLVHHNGLKPGNIHLIGFSLGAHVAGYIGKSIPGIHRITALDAAQPGFEGHPPTVRLHYTDAQFVDALHTDAEPFFPKFGFGYMGLIGCTDFYFNGGEDQPGCWKGSDYDPDSPKRAESFHMDDLFDPIKNISHRISEGIRCSHERSIDYWIEALRNTNCRIEGEEHRAQYERFIRKIIKESPLHVGMKEHYTPVGLETFTEPHHRGVFHVKTNSKKPFCLKLDD